MAYVTHLTSGRERFLVTQIRQWTNRSSRGERNTDRGVAPPGGYRQRGKERQMRTLATISLGLILWHNPASAQATNSELSRLETPASSGDGADSLQANDGADTF